MAVEEISMKLTLCLAALTPILILAACSNSIQSEDAPEPSGLFEQDDSTTAASADSGSTSFDAAYFTRSRGEGSYYAVNKPDDRDNNLTELLGDSGTQEGQIVEFGGTVYDGDDMPLSCVLIELRQTDNSSVYLHPKDPGADSRDQNFQIIWRGDDRGRWQHQLPHNPSRTLRTSSRSHSCQGEI